VLSVERPAIERHDQLELLASVELRFELFAADRPNGLGSQAGVRIGLVHGAIIAQSSFGPTLDDPLASAGTA
jgi:hypothetical protein